MHKGCTQKSMWISVSFDDTKGAESVPALVVKDRESLAIAAHTVPRRADYAAAIKQVSRDMEMWGILGDCTIRCDQETVLMDIAREIGKQRKPRTILEINKKGDSKSKEKKEKSRDTKGKK